MARQVLEQLLQSEEPSIRFKVLTRVLGEDLGSPQIVRLQQEIKNSPRVQALLRERGPDGRIPFHPYAKWYGAHWVMATLADLGYAPGDASLIPLRDQTLAWLLAIKPIVREGRARRCCSQEANAVYAQLTLGLADERTEELARRLLIYQWADGGWNCDKKPEAINSSFMESLIPLRALALHAKRTGSPASRQAAERAAEIFLKRRLFRRRSDGSVMRPDFVKLHYPCYWHYDILFGLQVMAEAGFIGDPRCGEALDLIESKRLPDGGFPAEGTYYHTIASASAPKRKSGASLVDWGGTSKAHMNAWVTAEALAVLQAAGRLRSA